MPLTIEDRRRGGRNRAKQFTSEYQAAVRANVKRESLVSNGKKGNATCVEKYGPAVHARRFALWRKTAPTALIKIVTGWLDEWWLTFTTEVEIVPGKVYADIVPAHRGRRIVIECDGSHWHENNDHVREDREGRDRERDEMIRALGYELIHLAEVDIRSGEAKAALAKFLEIHQ